jgi:tetratricopeptide (TPR) repeat protein
LWAEVLGDRHPNVAASLNSLGYIYTNMSRFAEALECLNRALEIREAAFGAENPAAGEVLANKAELLRRMHRKSEAKGIEARARRILSAHARENQLGHQIDVSVLVQARSSSGSY